MNGGQQTHHRQGLRAYREYPLDSGMTLTASDEGSAKIHRCGANHRASAYNKYEEFRIVN